ncbi:DUF3221 domain-containing protein [Alkalibacillus aidingensis]|uniref:DUF3221 domain-containing protein n=1 Tax=Alkalibacillus aidingensis TaxID=2747607 RepID=UPI001660927D|nr:DUF3221 domain-containing protein [Alkalibacillus aidingensis]
MDKQLHQLREAYLNHDETTFTQQDRQRIFSKITESENKSDHKRPLLPVKVIIPLLAVLLIGFTIFASSGSGLFHLAGDPEPEGEPAIEGYVVDQEDDRILVVGHSINEYDQYPAVWYSNVEVEVDIGQRIRAWHSSQNDSYPAQAEPDYIEILEAAEFNNSQLSVDQALEIALTSDHLDTFSIPIVQSTQFNDYGEEGDSFWVIEIKDAHESLTATFEVDDAEGVIISSAMDEQESDTDTDEGQEANLELETSLTNLFEHRFDELKLQQIQVDNETAYIDLFPPESPFALTTNEIREIHLLISSVIFEDESINEFYISVDGDHETWRDYTQAAEVAPTTREWYESQTTDEPNLTDVMIEYKATFESLYDHDDQMRLNQYDTIAEIRDSFTRVMSTELANRHIDTYVREQDGDLHLVATEAPIFLDQDEPYDVVEISDDEYHIKQEINNELTGHVEMIFTIIYENFQWIVDDVSSKPLGEEVESSLQRLSDDLFWMLLDHDWEGLSQYIHEERGLVYSPFSNVGADDDLHFEQEEVENFANDDTLYSWSWDQSGATYDLTASDFVEELIKRRGDLNSNRELEYDQIAFDFSLYTHDTQPNTIYEEYPNAYFVEYFYEPDDEDLNHHQQALRLVFEQIRGEWYLVALVRGAHNP